MKKKLFWTSRLFSPSGSLSGRCSGKRPNDQADTGGGRIAECYWTRRSVFAGESFGTQMAWSHPEQRAGTAMDDNRIGDQTGKVGNEAKSGVATAAETVSGGAGNVWTAGVEAGNTIRDAAIKTSE